MIQVQRGNKQLTISETSLEQYLTMGYSQIDEKGNVIKPGDAVITADIKAENKTLKAQLTKLQEENKILKEENKELKSEIKDLKKSDEDPAAGEKKTKK